VNMRLILRSSKFLKISDWQRPRAMRQRWFQDQ
jgi:hypothetical protein